MGVSIGLLLLPSKLIPIPILDTDDEVESDEVESILSLLLRLGLGFLRSSVMEVKCSPGVKGLTGTLKQFGDGYG